MKTKAEVRKHRGRRISPRSSVFAALAAALTVVTVGCVQQLDFQQPVRSCSNLGLRAGASLHEEAKHFLVRHFKERDPASLQYAYYATRDTEELTRSIRLCDDFDREFRRRGSELIRSARILRRVVVGNMRDNDPSVMVHLMGPAYDEVYPTDIR